ncbi:hypothetical protein U2F10_03140 [Leptothoe sp. EHU-05/26/07-4]
MPFADKPITRTNTISSMTLQEMVTSATHKCVKESENAVAARNYENIPTPSRLLIALQSRLEKIRTAMEMGDSEKIDIQCARAIVNLCQLASEPDCLPTKIENFLKDLE